MKYLTLLTGGKITRTYILSNLGLQAIDAHALTTTRSRQLSKYNEDNRINLYLITYILSRGTHVFIKVISR